jgi:hypothetical protein
MLKGWRCGEAHLRHQHTNPHEQRLTARSVPLKNPLI